MEIAEASGGGIIHYLPTEVFDGVVINMQTMYMSWLTMAVVMLIVFAATRKAEIIPSGIQNIVEVFIDWLNGLMEGNMGME